MRARDLVTVARRALVAATLALALGACPANPEPSDVVTPADAILYIRSNLSDADLVVDGHTVGAIGMLHGGVAVEPGTHRLELKRDDYFSSYREVKVSRAERLRFTMDLLPKLP